MYKRFTMVPCWAARPPRIDLATCGKWNDARATRRIQGASAGVGNLARSRYPSTVGSVHTATAQKAASCCDSWWKQPFPQLHQHAARKRSGRSALVGRVTSIWGKRLCEKMLRCSIGPMSSRVSGKTPLAPIVTRRRPLISGTSV